MFFRNTEAQSPVIRFNADGTSTLSYITIGGNLEVYFFLKGGAKQIIQQYHNFIGKPSLPPFWALGWHASSKLHQNLTDVQKVIDAYKTNKFPLQAIWLDKTYMDEFKEFTVSPNFASASDLAAFVKKLELANQKLIPVLGPGF